MTSPACALVALGASLAVACEPQHSTAFGGSGGTASQPWPTTSTTSSSTSTTSGGGGSGGGGFACHLPALGCDPALHAECLCRGCAAAECTDANGLGLADCVCAVCASDPFCADPIHCNHDAACDAFDEGCGCSDCVDHPDCSG
ncbi:MAG: hypothetical protein IT373_34245 [Polyangiaceae bacterium]|nr:hypothetical protein [Polyangiaceae bacterium]